MKRGASEGRSRLLLATFSLLVTGGFCEVAARVLLKPRPPAPVQEGVTA